MHPRDADGHPVGGFAGRLVRVLIEPGDDDGDAATRTAWDIDAALDAAGIDAPPLQHVAVTG